MSLGKLWINFVMGIVCALISLLFFNFLTVPFPSNQTSVATGDIITISGNTPIQVAIYANEASNTTTLTGENGLTITTHQGAMPGYYETIEPALPQSYQVTGAPAIVTVSEHATVLNPGVETRNAQLNRDLAAMMFIISFFMAFVLHRTTPPISSKTPKLWQTRGMIS